MKSKELRKKFLAAEKLLMESTTTRQKFESIRSLIEGVNPKVDKGLSSVSKAITKVEKIQKGKVIDLAAEHLPGETKEGKKRRKALLLLIRYWKQLQSEVKRLTKEYEKFEGKEVSFGEKAASGSKLLSTTKGPLGLVTVAAAVIVGGILLLQSISREIVIINSGCSTLTPTISVPVSIPGLSLPTEPIRDGQQAIAVVPPLTFVVDGTNKGYMNLRGYGLNLNFDFSGNQVDVLFNGSSLVGRQTKISLGSKPQHELVLRCFSQIRQREE